MDDPQHVCGGGAASSSSSTTPPSPRSTRDVHASSSKDLSPFPSVAESDMGDPNPGARSPIKCEIDYLSAYDSSEEEESVEESSEGDGGGGAGDIRPWIMEAISHLVMRSEESYSSTFLQRLEPGDDVKVLECGGDPAGSRLHVQLLDTGIDGWVSCVAKDGTELWRHLTARNEDHIEARRLHDTADRTFIVPEDLISDNFDPVGHWMECLRSTPLVLSRPTAASSTLQLRPHTAVQVVGVARRGDQIMVNTVAGVSGWVTVLHAGHRPQWRFLRCHVGGGVRVVPCTADVCDELLSMEHSICYSKNAGLRDWIKKSENPEANVFIDYAVGCDGSILGYCVWTVTQEPPLQEYVGIKVQDVVLGASATPALVGKLVSACRRTGRLRFPESQFQSIYVRCACERSIRVFERNGFFKVRLINVVGEKSLYYLIRSHDIHPEWSVAVRDGYALTGPYTEYLKNWDRQLVIARCFRHSRR